MYPHRIRLLTPWEAEPTDTQIVARRITVPARLADTGYAGFTGDIHLRRNFGYPGRIDAFERVWLNFAHVEGRAVVTLNDHVLQRDASGPLEVDVTALLAQRNRLDVLLHADSDRCGLTGEVALIIRCAAYLRDVTATRSPDGSLAICGQLLGHWPSALDLYVLIDNRNVHYQAMHTYQPEAQARTPPEPEAQARNTNEPAAQARAFEIMIPPADATGTALRIDLAHGPLVWYRIDLPLP